jgi:dolichol-phosphate mannosyltransferase
MTDNLPHPTAEPRVGSFLLSLVVPCYNEEQVIALTYERIVRTLTNREFDLQIVLVNDGSRDGTAAILAELRKNDPRVKVVAFPRNFGHQAAVAAGLHYADGHAVAVIDADLQDPPEVVLEFIDRWRLGYDVIYGVRTKRKESVLKRLGYNLFYRMFRALAHIDAPLDAGDFCLLDRKVLDTINALPEKNRFFRGLRAWVGARQIGVAYERHARAAGDSKYPLAKLLKLAVDGIFNFSTAPLTMVFCLGMTVATAAFLSLVLLLLMRIFDIPIFGMRVGDVPGFASTVLSVLLIGDVQLVSIGILGEYIGRIYQEIKGRPTYLVWEDHVQTSEAKADGAVGRQSDGQTSAEIQLS